MAYNEALANRVREALEQLDVVEKRMFSGVAFLVKDKMCINIAGPGLMVRIDSALYNELVEQPGCSEVIMRGKAVKGYLYVEEAAVASKAALHKWIDLALSFNVVAKKSRPKQKKRTV